jgi:hypothetical protein
MNDAPHRFHAGQMVRFTRGSPVRNAPDGSYQIVRQMPSGGGENQYRVKSSREMHERVVRESELDRA